MKSANFSFNLRALLPRLASLRISVACLMLLLILTAWGTVYQAGHGLYAAQVRFFHSWFFLIGGYIPFPGAQLVIWILFVNLLASMIFRVKWTVANLGNIVTHCGLMFLLAGSFITYHYSQESYLPLAEKEMANVSMDRRNWELAVWSEPKGDIEKKVSAVAIGPGLVGEQIDFSEFGFQAVVENYYRNCMPGMPDKGGGMNADMGMGMGGVDVISKLIPSRPAQDPEENLAGTILRLKKADGSSQQALLFGGQDQPVTVTTSMGPVQIALRQQRHPLPMTVKLLDVRKQDYPGTGIARSYESDVEVQSEGVTFKTRIYMNHPLHYKGFIFYQSSYNANAQGKESSVFAVVENRGRLVPYISGCLIFGGMALHFLLMLFGFGHRSGPRNGSAPAIGMAMKNGLKTKVNGAKSEVVR